MSQSVVRSRDDLRYLVGTEVSCSGRVKEFRKHSSRSDLDSVLLVNLIITPVPYGESIPVDHLWFLRRQFKKLGRVPEHNERIYFLGKIYQYTRLGGRSAERKILGHQDYGVKPLKYED